MPKRLSALFARLSRRGPGMSLLLLAGAFTVALVLVGCAREEQRPRVVLLGIDGGSWSLLDPMIARGELPNLAALAARGATADLATVEPVISPTVWTSIGTGRSPEAHGVTVFSATRRSVKVPTVWERLAASGLRVGLYDWLVAWPPRDLPGGFMVPGWLRRDDRVAPPDLYERLGLPPYFYSVANLSGPDDVTAIVEREVREKPRYWQRMWEELRPDVGVVVFYALDAACHRFYHHAFPEELPGPVEVDLRYADVIPRTLRGLDEAVGKIAATLAPEDNLVVVSDHGFRAAHRVDRVWGFDAERLLARAGLDTRRHGITAPSEWLYLALRIAPGPQRQRQATLARARGLLAGARTAAGEPLFLVEVATGQEGELPEGLPNLVVRTVQSQLPAHAVLLALPTEAMDALEADSVVSINGEQVPISAFAAPNAFSGQHAPVGIFLAAGGAIRHEPQRQKLSVLDVAPLVTYLAGEPIPDDFEGQLPRALIQPQVLAASPPRTVPAAQVARLPEEKGATATGTESEEEIDERLRSLGYI